MGPTPAHRTLDEFQRAGESTPFAVPVLALAILERFGSPVARELLTEIAMGDGPAAEAVKRAVYEKE